MAHCSLDRIKLFDAMIEGMERTTAATSSRISPAVSASVSTSGGNGGINNDVTVAEPLMTKLLQESDRPAVLNYLSTLSPAQRVVCLTALR